MLSLSHTPGLLSDLPARWLVTNGDSTVGPVHTELLLRGYMGGRIPRHCQVREVNWGFWRPLEGIREIGGVKRRLERQHSLLPHNLRDAVTRLPVAHDVGELLSLSLQLASQALAANAGLVHRYRDPVSLPVTSAAYGVSADVLGEVLAATDPAYLLALRGRGLYGSPSRGLAERLVGERLQQDAPMVSVAMTPIIASGRLIALLELGRTDHAFRADDTDELAEFAAQVARRIG